MSIPLNKQNRRPTDTVRQAHIPAGLTVETMSELGRDLFDISREYEESGGELLNERQIEVELIHRRGGHVKGE